MHCEVSRGLSESVMTMEFSFNDMKHPQAHSDCLCLSGTIAFLEICIKTFPDSISGNFIFIFNLTYTVRIHNLTHGEWRLTVCFQAVGPTSVGRQRFSTHVSSTNHKPKRVNGFCKIIAWSAMRTSDISYWTSRLLNFQWNQRHAVHEEVSSSKRSPQAKCWSRVDYLNNFPGNLNLIASPHKPPISLTRQWKPIFLCLAPEWIQVKQDPYRQLQASS